MNDYLISLIRTGVVTAIGVVLGWLTAHGVGIPAEHSSAFVASSVGIVTAIYYAIVRAVEARAVAKGPAWLVTLIGVFLGGRAPVYAQPAAARAVRRSPPEGTG